MAAREVHQLTQTPSGPQPNSSLQHIIRHVHTSCAWSGTVELGLGKEVQILYSQPTKYHHQFHKVPQYIECNLQSLAACNSSKFLHQHQKLISGNMLCTVINQTSAQYSHKH